ncbi:hypothetical protein [Streptomyces sp. NPDC093600]|uniref:hypothetical protein n=1 Tax=Streptomyces sp. NPDC093600 TaxID=3366047 RepID=UPI003824013F
MSSWTASSTTARSPRSEAVNELETVVSSIGPVAALLTVRGEKTPMPRIAEALGMTERDASSRLFHYKYMR